MELKDVWSYVFDSEELAQSASKEINLKFGPISTIGKDNKKLVVISAEATIMEKASEIAKGIGGKLKGPNLSWT